MTAGNIRLAHLVDTVEHEINSAVHSHCIYKSVWLSVIGEQLILEKEPASQSTS